MKKTLSILAILAHMTGMGQGSNMEYEIIDISPDPYFFLHADIDRVPGTNQFLLSAQQGFPFYVLHGESLDIEATHDVGNWYAGSRITVSSSGKYTLLKQLFYLDFAPNNDREVKFQVIDTQTGNVHLKIDAAHDATFHPNEESLIVLEGDEVYAYPLNGDRRKFLFPVAAATNCVAVSPDGSQIAISHLVEDEYLNEYVTKKRQKKNYKIYKKYRQCISVYDANSFNRLYTVDEMFDLPYLLNYSPDGKHLICYSVPHTKVVAKTGMNGSKYISKIESANGKTTTVGFVSNSVYEPDIEFNDKGNLIALVTVNRSRFPEVWVCNFETGDILARFELAKRLFENMGKNVGPDDGRVGVAFAPDDSYLLITNGSTIIKWTIPYASNN